MAMKRKNKKGTDIRSGTGSNGNEDGRGGKLSTIIKYSVAYLLGYATNYYMDRGFCPSIKQYTPSTVSTTTAVTASTSVIDQQQDKDETIMTATTPTITTPPTKKIANHEFDTIVDLAYEIAFPPKSAQTSTERAKFELSNWNDRTTGGLTDPDRVMLADLYSNANAVFEYGLGESTYLAAHLGVPNYAGIDSDAVWVSSARKKAPDIYRFYFGDIGTTGGWGYPLNATLEKNILNYQLQPLIMERRAFDVYMVDGRWRLPCALASFLHASKYGNPNPTVLIHDCGKDLAQQRKLTPSKERDVYKAGDDILDLVQHSGEKLCVYKRKAGTTDEQILQKWKQHHKKVVRR